MGVAVKVTDVPAHIGLADAEIMMLTGRIGLRVIQTGSDIAGFPLEHTRLEFSRHRMQSPSEGIYVNQLLLEPVGILLTNHS